jgi:cytoskeleton protein RodZ
MTAVLNDISEGPALEPVKNQHQDPDPHQVQSLGDLLRSKREARGLTPQQAAEQLRLLPHWIDAFESNRFDTLVAPVYSRGYLRKYAILLDLPPEEILARYEKLHDIPSTPALAPIKPTASSTVKPSGAPAWLGGAAFIAVAAALVITQMDRDGESGQDAPLPAVAAMVPAPAATTAPQQVAVVTPPGSEATADVAQIPSTAVEVSTTDSTAIEAGGVVASPEATFEPAALTPAAPETTVPLPSTASEPAAGTDLPPEEPPLARLEVPTPNAAQMLNVKLSFKDKSWATVYAADGTRLLYELGRRGRPRSLSSRAPLTVIVGAIDAVEMRVNDKLVPIPRQPGKDSIKFILDVAGGSGGTDTRSAADVGSGG